jgi:hypothetical protein
MVVGCVRACPVALRRFLRTAGALRRSLAYHLLGQVARTLRSRC